jgi:hypothetical protein
MGCRTSVETSSLPKKLQPPRADELPADSRDERARRRSILARILHLQWGNPDPEEILDLEKRVRRSNSSVSLGSPTSLASSGFTDSQMLFSEKDQTFTLFDWDDTLFPTSWMLKQARTTASENIFISDKNRHSLRTVCEGSMGLMREAQAISHSCIVTNAKRPWIEDCCDMVAQDMNLRLVGPNCPVHYANEAANPPPTATRSERLTVTKARVMNQVVTTFYSRYHMQSWKNVISIGDAFYEHAAVHDVIRNRPEYSSKKKCRMKRIKFLRKPSVEEMVLQLRLVRSWFHLIAQSDTDVDVDFTDENTLLVWVHAYRCGKVACHSNGNGLSMLASPDILMPFSTSEP